MERVMAGLVLGVVLVFAGCIDQGQEGDIPAGVVLVSPWGDGTDGRSWATAYPVLQDGVDAAFAAGGGEVWVAAGTYVSAGDYAPVLVMRPGVDIYGGFCGGESRRTARDWNDHPTILDGQSAVDHVAIGADDAVLDGLTVTGECLGVSWIGVGSGGSVGLDWIGGGLLCDGTSPQIRHCRFENNNDPGISEAFTMAGAGIGCVNGAAPVIEDTVFIGNKSGGGAALGCQDSYPSLVRCRLERNRSGDGGAVYMRGGKLAIINCAFITNSAIIGCCGSGGAISAEAGAVLDIQNTLFYGNLADFSGAIHADPDTRVTMAGCTVVENHGCGSSWDAAITAGTLDFRNTIVYNWQATPHMVYATAAAFDHCAIAGMSWWGPDGTAVVTGAGNIDAAGDFTAIPQWVAAGDLGGTATGEFTDWKRTGFAVDDIIVLNGDGVARRVTAVEDTVVRFTPSLASACWSAIVENWGRYPATLVADLAPAPGAAYINAGDSALLPADAWDLDGDGNTIEAASLDLAGTTRCRGTVDMGAFEFQPGPFAR